MKATLLAAALIAACAPCPAAEPDARPNILFMMSDDHCAQAISAYGGRLATVCPTPHIDRLAAEGRRFDNCFVTNSICTPSRASVLTGKYAHKNGVYKFTALNQSQPTLPKMMRRAGYTTAIIGKYHLHSNPVGFDFWSILPGQGKYHDPEFVEMGDQSPSGWVRDGARTGYKGHCTDVIAAKAIDALNDLQRNRKPFLLFCQFKAPHDTWDYAERYESFLADVDVPEPANLFDEYAGRSDMMRRQLQYIGSEWGNHTNFKSEASHLSGREKRSLQYQLYLKKYLRCVKGVDDNVGRILDHLDESGLAGNTIVIYTADQGFFLGEHGLYDKRIMYEEALRAPLLVRWPGRVPPGSSTDEIALNVDFAPTLLEIAGAEPDPQMQGRSLVPLLAEDSPTEWRESMYYRYYRSHFETEAHYGVRTKTHKLIYCNEIDQWELYDLRRDPTEMHNLASDPSHAQVFAELRAELQRLQTELEDNPNNRGDRPDIGRLKPPPLTVNDSLLNIGRGELTILLRFRAGAGGTLLARRRAAAAEGFRVDVAPGQIAFHTAADSHYADVSLDDGDWHTLAMVFQEDQLRAYLDGAPAFANPDPAWDDIAASQFRVGAGFGGSGRQLDGAFDQVQFYDRPLAAGAIQAFAAGEDPGVPLTWKWVK